MTILKALCLDLVIDQALAVDRSGYVVLAEIIIGPKRKSLVLGQLGVHETMDVASWYILWERREARKGEKVKHLFSSGSPFKH